MRTFFGVAGESPYVRLRFANRTYNLQSLTLPCHSNDSRQSLPSGLVARQAEAQQAVFIEAAQQDGVAGEVFGQGGGVRCSERAEQRRALDFAQRSKQGGQLL